ncbi:MAG: flagellar hook protein [Marinobacter sp. T13-3]|nr:MAG: flagellar hook protein [Marinobacter sp. T13-3]
MAFNTGLSGLRAAQVDLDVTGNNIANASTVGFKSSRAQFGDLYANGFLSSGSNPVGDGVTVQDIQQQFGQGNISFTDNGLDMAIDGDGFFVLKGEGNETRYSRAGQFGIDKDGKVVNNQGMTVQGYTADEDGNLSTGDQGDMQIETGNLAPRKTTNLETDVNLDSREPVLERRVRSFDVAVDGPEDITNEKFTLTYTDGSQVTVGPFDSASEPDPSAKTVALTLNDVPGVTASGTTTATIGPARLNYNDTNFQMRINTIPLDNLSTGPSTSLTDLADQITGHKVGEYSISARVNDAGDLEITDGSGEKLTVEWGVSNYTDDNQNGVGKLNITTDRSVDSVTPESASTYFADNFDVPPTPINTFNPLDQRTYNHATSTTIYDSLGNSHELTQFFVKEPSPGSGVGKSQWSIYLQVDGEFVGGTKPETDTNPKQAYTAVFSEDGSLDSMTAPGGGRVSDMNEIIVTDWTPKDPNGDPNGAEGPPLPQNVEPSDDIPTPIPEDSGFGSSFVIDLSDSTQYGAAFGVNDQNQNGYTTGRLSGLDVSDEGVIFARYTNGQSKSLGQVALASFNNTDGLSPVGDTSWVQTFESGPAIIGKPGTGTLGGIAASSVEESNVDLSEELVNLIIAQRNYQANAKTIETSDAVTQTIINLR